MFCVDKNKGQSIENRGTATDVEIIGPLAQSDFDYIRKSDIASLDLSEADVTEIGNDSDNFDEKYVNSFCDSKLKSVMLPKKLKVIKNWAFRYCTSLISINIPSGVTAIGDCAFGDCPSLTSIDIPSNVTTIGDYAFDGCTSLASINLRFYIPPSIYAVTR